MDRPLCLSHAKQARLAIGSLLVLACFDVASPVESSRRLLAAEGSFVVSRGRGNRAAQTAAPKLARTPRNPAPMGAAFEPPPVPEPEGQIANATSVTRPAATIGQLEAESHMQRRCQPVRTPPVESGAADQPTTIASSRDSTRRNGPSAFPGMLRAGPNGAPFGPDFGRSVVAAPAPRAVADRFPPVHEPLSSGRPAPSGGWSGSEQAEQTAAMRAVAERANELTHSGLSLAQRGALYSARAELIQALRTVSQALDAQAGQPWHSRALAAGLRALKEADDFAPNDSQWEADWDVQRLIAAHHTPVMKQAGPSECTSLVALQCYYSFAQEQLASSGGDQQAASAALCGLARVHMAMAEGSDRARKLSGPRAMSLHQAALLVDPQNHLAANELGVLLARYGQLERARDALLQSVRARPLAETWHNLSVVHARLGEIELAQLARREAERAVQSSRRDEADMRSSRTGGPIRWVDPSEFAAAAPGWGPDAADVEWRPAAAETPPRRLPSGRLGGCPAAPPRPYKPAGPGVVALASDRCAAEPSLPADDSVRLCQACVPVIYGVDCESCGRCGEARWNAGQPLPWEVFAHGEYVGPHRLQHVPEYHLRVDDRLEFIYRLTREESPEAYQLNVGDEIRIESMADPAIERTLAILPDGMIALQLLGQVRAARRTVAQLQQDLEEKYKKYYKVPAITVTPVKVDTKLEDLRAAIDSRFGFGGQSRQTRVTPEGAVQLTGIGSVPAQGLTLAELKREIDERYAELVAGIEVTPVLLERAPRYVYVIGEVQNSGRYDLTGPTTVMQAIAMAGGWRNGGNLREVVVFRRAEDWRLIATKLDIRGALLGKRPCPADELWVRDSDIVLVPKSALMLADDFIDLVFTRGIYGVFPFQGATINFSKLSTL